MTSVLSTCSSSSSSSFPFSNEQEAEVAATMMELQDHKPKEFEAEQVDRVLTEALNKLSLRERENIVLDMHGVKDHEIGEEEAEEKLEDLEEELELVAKKEAYERALELNRAYVENRDFRLQVLRAVEFDAKQAAEKLVLHFEVKRELFVRDANNDSILGRNITWEDLDDHDKLVVLSGLFQVGSKRDVAGRTIFFCIAAVMQPSMLTESMCRALWYVRMSALLTDREMRRKGVIGVVIDMRDKSIPSASVLQFVRVNSSLPCESAAVHYGYKNPALQPAVMGFKLLLLTTVIQQSFRSLFHFGDMKKISFELQTYGIPTECVPVKSFHKDGGTGVSLEWHMEWLQTIREFEAMHVCHPSAVLHKETACIVPGRFDVLFGKSKMARQHTGTTRCHNLVRSLWGVYEEASRRDKTKVADEVISIIEESGGLFLRWEKSASGCGYWVAVEHEVARAKVSHIFRHLRELEQIKDFQAKSSGAENTCSGDDTSSAEDRSATDRSFDSKKTPAPVSFDIEPPCAKSRKTST